MRPSHFLLKSWQVRALCYDPSARGETRRIRPSITFATQGNQGSRNSPLRPAPRITTTRRKNSEWSVLGKLVVLLPESARTAGNSCLCFLELAKGFEPLTL
jgi:hypothetical protein